MLWPCVNNAIFQPFAATQWLQSESTVLCFVIENAQMSHVVVLNVMCNTTESLHRNGCIHLSTKFYISMDTFSDCRTKHLLKELWVHNINSVSSAGSCPVISHSETKTVWSFNHVIEFYDNKRMSKTIQPLKSHQYISLFVYLVKRFFFKSLLGAS